MSTDISKDKILFDQLLFTRNNLLKEVLDYLTFDIDGHQFTIKEQLQQQLEEKEEMYKDWLDDSYHIEKNHVKIKYKNYLGEGERIKI